MAKANGGAAGVDGVRFEQIESEGRQEWLRSLQEELHSKTYRPEPVRRVKIPKPGGGQRPLGIATIRDRVARRISDRQVLRVIKMWLKTPLEERDENGNNLKTRSADLGFEVRGFSFVILSRGSAAEALEWTEQVMTRIGLTLKRTKTKLVPAKQERFDFFGYTFGPHRCKKDGHGYWGASPSAKSVARLRRKVREVLRPSEVGCWEEVSGRLTECWWAGCGWAGRMTSRTGPG